ncbi:putative ribonucleotide reductase large subunit [Yellowstone lake phycodnavirus 3]|jgi:hypothetical protein|uniref:putative ribonucleotide reductase large subunit n=1 Tax=Yellowstone lake phycodnavirus 3 TaxID=1586715 RepID=UPI0006EBD8BB|nr:putative ribonucleotide reductase large subunit [Yellowstone lake phycodnavirus 3]BAT22616.1 putative ribonucleotide reductase large subunit [Yellowstone lake phycodnavirus 3]
MASKYLPSPLADAFFSDFNKETIQDQIASAIKDKTGVELQRQSYSDLDALMKRVYVNMKKDTNSNVRQQVDDMNGRVTEEATGTISTGLLQQIVYLRDISRNAVPLEVPVSTSTYGNKIPSNFKIGF